MGGLSGDASAFELSLLLVSNYVPVSNLNKG